MNASWLTKPFIRPWVVSGVVYLLLVVIEVGHHEAVLLILLGRLGGLHGGVHHELAPLRGVVKISNSVRVKTQRERVLY